MRNLEVLERQRLGLIFLFIFSLVLMVLILALGIIVIFFYFYPESFFLMIVLFTILLFYVDYRITMWKKRVKKEILTQLIKYPNLHYYPERGLALEKVLESGLVKQVPDVYKASDLIEGSIEGIPFESSAVGLYRREYDEKKKEERLIPIFVGKLYLFNLPFSYRGEIYLTPKPTKLEKFLAFVILIVSLVLLIKVAVEIDSKDSKVFLSIILFITVALVFFLVYEWVFRKRVKLESSEFNRLFDVQASDQIEVRKFLVPIVQEALVNFAKEVKRGIRVVIKGNKLWFALSGGNERFRISIFKPVYDQAKQEVEKELQLMKKIVDTLRLSQEAIRKGKITTQTKQENLSGV
jgi:Ca2+/Na+ antiporter